MRQRTRQAAVIAGLAAVMSAGLWDSAAYGDEKPNVSARLTSQPVGAQVGESVTHEISISAAAIVGNTSAKVYFATTVPLEQATVKAASGGCVLTSSSTVTCDIDAQQAVSVPISITVTGTVSSSGQAGTVVHNIATIVVEGDGNPADNGSANGYLLTRSGSPATTPTAAAPSAAAVVPVNLGEHGPASADIDKTSGRVPVWLAGTAKILVILACIAGGVLLVARRPLVLIGERRPRGRHRRPPQWTVILRAVKTIAVTRIELLIRRTLRTVRVQA